MYKSKLVIALLLLAVLVNVGCRKRPHSYVGMDFDEIDYKVLDSVPLDMEDPIPDEVLPEEEAAIFVVPFTRRDGVKYIDAEINGALTVPMILDTGCSTTLISLAEAEYLASKGALTQQDYGGETFSVIADGSISVNSIVILRQVAIKGIDGDLLYCGNVEALVSDNPKAPLLLGNGILDRLGSYMIDNTNECFLIRLE